MSTEQQQSESKDEQWEHDYGVARYAVLYEAWATTSIEIDKQILTLSSAAIALLVGLISQENIDNVNVYWLFGLTLFCLVIVICMTLYGLHKSVGILERAAMNEEHDQLSFTVSLIDRFIKIGFAVSLVFVCLCGAALVYEKGDDTSSTNTKPCGSTSVPQS